MMLETLPVPDKTKPRTNPVALKAAAAPEVSPALAAVIQQIAEPVATIPVPPALAMPAPKLPPAAAPAASAIMPVTKETTMDATINTAADQAQADAKTMFAEAGDRAQTAMAKGSQSIEEMNAFAKGNLEAVVESTKIYAKGIEAMGQDAAAFAKKSFEDATAAFKSMAAVKSPTDFFKLQSDFARTAFDAMVAETSKSTEKMVKLAGEVAQPISNRVALASEKMKIAA